MTAIWTNDGEKWRLTQPHGFPDEATLHGLIAETPGMLPLAGSPDLVILGREVQLGSGYADLVAVESTGRPVIIEVKLASNAEARRAVVAQLLAYAAYLHGMTASQLEKGPLSRSLHAGGHATVLDLVQAQDQQGAVNGEEFKEAFAAHLSDGKFRLVFVLDDAPPELVTLVAYLEHVTPDLQIDLVTVSAFEVNATQVVLPKRVTPERHTAVVEQSRAKQTSTGTRFEGADEFETSIAAAPVGMQEELRNLLTWARELEAKGYVKLSTFRGSGGRTTLLPTIVGDTAGLVTIWNDQGRPFLSFYQTVFERRAEEYIEKVEALIKPSRIGKGTTTDKLGVDLLTLLTEVYATAASRARE